VGGGVSGRGYRWGVVSWGTSGVVVAWGDWFWLLGGSVGDGTVLFLERLWLVSCVCWVVTGGLFRGGVTLWVTCLDEWWSASCSTRWMHCDALPCCFLPLGV
jgi:hypothetical protein